MPPRRSAHPQRASRRALPSARLHYASAEHDADMLYATGFMAPDPCLFLGLGRRRLLLIGDVDLDRARASAHVSRVLRWEAYAQRIAQAGRPATVTAVAASLLREHQLRRLLVPRSFPLGLARDLGRAGISLVSAVGPFWPRRENKRPEEVRAIVTALRSAEAGIEAGIASLRACAIGRDGFLHRSGRRFTAEDLRTAINTAVMARGSVPAHTICAAGDQALDPHEAGHGPLRAHTSIVIDVFPRSESTGYFGDITRTVVRGRATERLREMYAAVEEGVRLGLRRLRHGTRGQNIHREIVELFAARGFETREIDGRLQGFFHGTGHGVGLEIHEAPWVSVRRPYRLRAGHVVTIEPGLYYRGLGGVRIEDLALVTRTGPRNLTRLPKVLEI